MNPGESSARSPVVPLPTRPSGKRIVRQAAKVAFHYGGGVPLYRFLNRSRLRILNAHRYTADFRPTLDARCAYLRKHYNVVSMDHVRRLLWDGVPLPAHPVAHTVDDGYRDFYLHAYPVYAAYRIPVTVFLVSEFLDGRTWMWWDKVTYLFKRTSRSAVAVPLPSGQPLSLTLSTPVHRESAAKECINALTRFPHPRVLDVVSRLPEILGVSLPAAPPDEYAPLSWDEVREMRAHGITFGAHTMTHALLPDVEDPAVLRWELEASKRRIEEETGAAVDHFAYPNGDHSPDTRAAVRAAGFRTASTTDPGTNDAGTDPFALHRLNAGSRAPEWWFLERAAGFWPAGLSGH
jgi:peptidoglycan/xylan/chitin deacetylase (PgdA/CDA1 family)